MALKEQDGTVAGPVGGVDLFLVLANALLYHRQSFPSWLIASPGGKLSFSILSVHRSSPLRQMHSHFSGTDVEQETHHHP